MAYYDTGFINTTFYGVSYGIRVEGHADRADGSTGVRFHGSIQERQNTYTYNTDAHYCSIDSLLGDGQIKPGGRASIGNVFTRWFDTTIGIGIGTTSAGFTARFRGGGNARTLGFTAWFNDGYSAPTGLTLSNVSKTEQSVSGRVSISGWGNNSGGAKYLELGITQHNNSLDSRKFQPVHTGATYADITVTQSSAGGYMTISPNTRYYLAIYASNGNRSAGVSFVGDIVTLSRGYYEIVKIKPTKVIFKVNAVTGVYQPTVQFRFRKKGTDSWKTSTESFVGGSGELLVTGFVSSTRYEVQQIVTTDAGTWYSDIFEIKTKPASIAIYPNGRKFNVSFRLIYPDGRKREVERWRKI